MSERESELDDEKERERGLTERQYAVSHDAGNIAFYHFSVCALAQVFQNKVCLLK